MHIKLQGAFVNQIIVIPDGRESDRSGIRRRRAPRSNDSGFPVRPSVCRERLWGDPAWPGRNPLSFPTGAKRPIARPG